MVSPILIWFCKFMLFDRIYSLSDNFGDQAERMTDFIPLVILLLLHCSYPIGDKKMTLRNPLTNYKKIQNLFEYLCKRILVDRFTWIEILVRPILNTTVFWTSICMDIVLIKNVNKNSLHSFYPIRKYVANK